MQLKGLHDFGLKLQNDNLLLQIGNTGSKILVVSDFPCLGH